MERAGGSAAPRFAIIVPAYQAAATLAETLDAILAQTFDDWECAVVDDGSTDATFEIASRYATADPRFLAITKANQGTAGAYSAGVLGTTGAFIVLCSADDVLLPEHLSRMSAFIEAERDYDIYTTNGYRWRPDGSRKLVYPEARFAIVHSQSLADVIGMCPYGVGATYRRRIFGLVDGYRHGIFAEDYDFWLRAMARGARHRFLPEPLSLFRISATQKSADKVRVLQTDIALVSGLSATHRLSAAERQAIRARIVERSQRLAPLLPPQPNSVARMRRRIRRALRRLLGKERLDRWARAARR
ncbi:MAG: glycosyltransferase [Chloroflexota bacterium]